MVNVFQKKTTKIFVKAKKKEKPVALGQSREWSFYFSHV